MHLDWTFLKMSHSDPLVRAFKDGTMERASPSDSLASVLDLRSKISMVSLVSYLRNAKDLFLLREPVISFAGQTLSTLLMSRDKDMQKNMEIAVSADTETTKWYMSNVLKSMGIGFKLKPSECIEAEDLLNEADYALVIGDEALKVFSTKLRILLDVGYEFLRIFQIFPLYAVSVSREENLETSKDWIAEADRYKEECADKLAARLGISTILTKRYYGNVRYFAESSTQNTLSFMRRSITY
ncbi:MAG: MqnA/MqnD/SBP family protein [Thermoplasmata archaeon]